MRFTLGIDMDNAAFHHDECDGECKPGTCNTGQLDDLIDQVSRRIVQGGTFPRTGIVQDTNGNTVGSWSIK